MAQTRWILLLNSYPTNAILIEQIIEKNNLDLVSTLKFQEIKKNQIKFVKKKIVRHRVAWSLFVFWGFVYSGFFLTRYLLH